MTNWENFVTNAWVLRNHYENDNVPNSKLKIHIISQIVEEIFEEGSLPSHLVIDDEFKDVSALLDASTSVLKDLNLEMYKLLISANCDVEKSISTVLFELS